MNELKKKAFKAIEARKGRLNGLAQKLYKNPELMFEEHKACSWLGDELKALGYKVKKNVGGLPTAFHATLKTGNTGPTIAILAEYDALAAGGCPLGRFFLHHEKFL